MRSPLFTAPFSLFAATAIVLSSCNQGAYPADIFSELHRQPAYQRLQPNRLAPPPDAVPMSGGDVRFTYEQAGRLSNSLPRSGQTLNRARETYRVNCAMCHGQTGRGDGIVASYFKAAGRVPPVDYTGERVRSRSDGQLYWLITNGIGGMPAFGDLLSDDDRWALVYFIRDVQAS